MFQARNPDGRTGHSAIQSLKEYMQRSKALPVPTPWTGGNAGLTQEIPRKQNPCPRPLLGLTSSTVPPLLSGEWGPGPFLQKTT